MTITLNQMILDTAAWAQQSTRAAALARASGDDAEARRLERLARDHRAANRALQRKPTRVDRRTARR